MKPSDLTADLGPERELVAAAEVLSAGLRAFRDAVRAYEAAPERVLELDPSMSALAYSAESLDAGVAQFHQALGVISDARPVAAASSRGVEWSTMLDPASLLRFASFAAPDDEGYLGQLVRKAACYAAQLEELRSECRRPTRSGEPCRSIPIYWPGRGRSTACSRHLADAEKKQLRRVWDEVVDRFACPGCPAVGGEPCSEDAEGHSPVDGQWPRIRAFDGLKVHDVRLRLGDGLDSRPDC